MLFNKLLRKCPGRWPLERLHVRCFFGVASHMPKIPLDQEFPVANDSNELASSAKISPVDEPIVGKLSNGISFAVRETADPITTIGVAVAPSHQFESENCHGFADFIASMPFMSTSSTSSFSISQQLQAIGAQVKAENTRNGIFYSVDVLRSHFPTAMDIMADCLFNPKYLIHEVNNAKFEYTTALKEISSDVQTEEDIHLAAFGRTGLGLPLKASRESIDQMSTELLRAQHAKIHHPSRMALSALGISPEVFRDSADRFFGQIKGETDVKSEKDVVKSGKDGVKGGNDVAKSENDVVKSEKGDKVKDEEDNEIYKGGSIRMFVEDRHKETFYTVAFKTVGWNSNDVPALCVLGSLLGGGSSFSAGGPGKGMYSRLNKNLITRRGVNSCTVVVHLHKNLGLFGISASADYKQAKDLISAVAIEVRELANPELLSDEEFMRAKNSAISTYLFNLEHRQILADDYAKQLLLYGKIYSVEELLKKLQGVTREDVLRLAKSMGAEKKSVALRGNTLGVE